MSKINELTEQEYNLVRILDALGEEKRFLIFKNLRTNGSCYADELSEALKISRAALEKHARRLINTKLVNKKFIVEGGRARARLESTMLAKDVMLCLLDLLKRTDLGTSLQEKAVEVRARVKGIKAVLSKLERKLNSGEVTQAEYNKFKQEYESEMAQLEERMGSIVKMAKKALA